MASFPTIVETTSSWTKIHNPWLHCQLVLEQHDQSDIAGALPVAQHSAVAIASHAIPAGVVIIQSSFEKIGITPNNVSTKIPLSNKISRSIKRKTVSEHHSVPIVPLTTATAHPHGFSYGFAMFSQMITFLLLSFLCIFPSIWGLPTPFQMTISSCYGHAFYFWATYSLKMWPLALSTPHLLWLMVVGSPHTTLASVRLALSDITADSLEVSQSLPDTTFVFYQSSSNPDQFNNPPSGYLGHHGLVGLKSAPCVNVNNVPVPCAHPGLLHHGYLG